MPFGPVLVDPLCWTGRATCSVVGHAGRLTPTNQRPKSPADVELIAQQLRLTSMGAIASTIAGELISTGWRAASSGYTVVIGGTAAMAERCRRLGRQARRRLGVAPVLRCHADAARCHGSQKV